MLPLWPEIGSNPQRCLFKKPLNRFPSKGQLLKINPRYNALFWGVGWLVGWFPEPTWLQSMLAYQARAAGKDSYNLFTQLGDVRGQAAALLVQSHVCIKSKNQELDFSVMDEINHPGRSQNECDTWTLHVGSGRPELVQQFFRIPQKQYGTVLERYYKDIIFMRNISQKKWHNFLFGLEKQLNFIQLPKVCQFVQPFFLGVFFEQTLPDISPFCRRRRGGPLMQSRHLDLVKLTWKTSFAGGFKQPVKVVFNSICCTCTLV